MSRRSSRPARAVSHRTGVAEAPVAKLAWLHSPHLRPHLPLPSAPKERLTPVRPGMDLTKIALPTFVLEPRSLLERITDFFSHPDLIFG